MCGICGYSGNPQEWVDTATLASIMLQGIEERGRHATGCAWTQGEDLWVEKNSVPATEFVKTMDIPTNVSSFLGHTRWASQGSPKNPDNNHPIDVAGIVGIHNGCLSNDDELFEMIGKEKRIAEVDSEAAFAWLLHSGLPVVEALPYIHGSAALAWMNLTDPKTLHLARLSYSPVIVGWTIGGSILFASTKNCIYRAAEAVDMVIDNCISLDEGTYITIRDGHIETYDTFEVETSRALSNTEKKALNLA